MWYFIRNNILAGLFVTIPILISIMIIWFIYEKLTSWSVELFLSIPWIGNQAYNFPFNDLIRIGSILIILFIVFFIGLFARNTIGGRIISFGEAILLKIPMFNIIFSTMKNIGDALRNQKNGMFRKVVLFEYPRKGIYCIGFITNEDNNWEISTKIDFNLVSIFLPTTPNPTSGFLLLLPQNDLIHLDITVSDAMKLIISGGAVTPSNLPFCNKPNNINTENGQ